ASAVLVLGGLKMIQLKSYTWAVFSAVWAMVPWSCGWIVGFPIGILALVVLRKPYVRAAFAGGHRLDFARGQANNPQEIVTEVAGGFFCIPIKLGSIGEHRYPGMLRLESDALVLEYMKGYVRAKVREAIIQISHLRLVRLTDGWFSDSLVLQTASLKSLE